MAWWTAQRPRTKRGEPCTPSAKCRGPSLQFRELSVRSQGGPPLLCHYCSPPEFRSSIQERNLNLAALADRPLRSSRARVAVALVLAGLFFVPLQVSAGATTPGSP